MEILSKFRPVQSLVSVYMLVIVQVFGMLPMRAIFCLTLSYTATFPKKDGKLFHIHKTLLKRLKMVCIVNEVAGLCQSGVSKRLNIKTLCLLAFKSVISKKKKAKSFLNRKTWSSQN